MGAMSARVERALRFKDLVREMTVSELRAKYFGALGIYWSVVNPLLMLAVYTFVFSLILGVRFNEGGSTQDYVLYLFCGMLPWLSFQESVTGSTGVLVRNANLVQNVVFPVKALHAAVIISALVGEAFGIAMLLVFKLILTGEVGVSFLLLPLPIFFQALFTMGLGLMLSALNVFFRDTTHIIRPVLMVWMYLTPIFYPLSIVPERYRIFITLNPLTSLVSAYRDLLLNDRLPDWGSLLYFAALSVIVFYAGYRFFTRNHLKLVDYI